ncbi:MAG: hypothetical protein PWP40_361 [Rhodocyclaceae bacterium]|nr:hypothetical protein [Rhodocyclaceae bacterium]
MTQGLPRTRFNSAGLVRLLAELAVAEVADTKQDFAARLSEWLDLKDALALYSALNSAAARPAARAMPAALLSAELARLRATLGAAVTAGPGLPTPLPNATPEEAADFAPFHRHYLAQQRAMAAAIAPLRAAVRTALGRQSAALGQLAALDAVMEQALAAREASLLATVPVLLGRRFAHLLEAHRRAREAAQPDDPGQWMQAGGWLARFCADLQRVLLAELDLRLLPVAGLLAALDKDSTELQ